MRQHNHYGIRVVVAIFVGLVGTFGLMETNVFGQFGVQTFRPSEPAAFGAHGPASTPSPTARQETNFQRQDYVRRQAETRQADQSRAVGESNLRRVQSDAESRLRSRTESIRQTASDTQQRLAHAQRLSGERRGSEAPSGRGEGASTHPSFGDIHRSTAGQNRPNTPDSTRLSAGQSRPNTPNSTRPSAGQNRPNTPDSTRPSAGQNRPNTPNRVHPGQPGRAGGAGSPYGPRPGLPGWAKDAPESRPRIQPSLHDAFAHRDPGRFVPRGPSLPGMGPDRPEYWDHREYRPSSSDRWAMIAGTVLSGLQLSWNKADGVQVAWYRPGWWGDHPPVHPPVTHYRYRPELYPESYWWRTPRWSVVVGWTPRWAEWSEPIYYDYGTEGNVTYEDNRVFINGESVGTIDDYRDSAVELAAPSLPLSDSGSEPVTTNSEWLGLGTFAMVADKNEPIDPEHCFAIQMAVNRDGIVSGEFMDPSVPDQTFAVQGNVDPKTQRVAFTITGLDDFVFETGIYNLTQDQTSLLVHDGEEEMRNYLLVRLEEPKN